MSEWILENVNDMQEIFPFHFYLKKWYSHEKNPLEFEYITQSKHQAASMKSWNTEYSHIME